MLSPLDVKCPLCKARPGVKCSTKIKRMKPGKTIRVHFKRVKAWKSSLVLNRRADGNRLVKVVYEQDTSVGS